MTGAGFEASLNLSPAPRDLLVGIIYPDTISKLTSHNSPCLANDARSRRDVYGILHNINSVWEVPTGIVRIETHTEWEINLRDFAIGSIVEEDCIQRCRIICLSITLDWMICDTLDVDNLIASEFTVGRSLLGEVLPIFEEGVGTNRLVLSSSLIAARISISPHPGVNGIGSLKRNGVIGLDSDGIRGVVLEVLDDDLVVAVAIGVGGIRKLNNWTGIG